MAVNQANVMYKNVLWIAYMFTCLLCFCPEMFYKSVDLMSLTSSIELRNIEIQNKLEIRKLEMQRETREREKEE